MYIHAGGDVIIDSKDLIAIIDRETVESSEEVQMYLRKNKKQIIQISDDSYKSLIITIPHIFLSPIASVTMKKRFMDKANGDFINRYFESVGESFDDGSKGNATI